MKKYKVFFVLFLSITFFVFLFLKFWKENGNLKGDERFSYFKPVLVDRFSPTGLPCIYVQLENEKILLELDLGFRGCLSVKPSLLEKIIDKEFIDSRLIYGFKGNEYRENVYSIPKVKIGESAFRNIYIQDGNTEEFINDTAIQLMDDDLINKREGQIGWELFLNSNLLLDLGNSKIAFCDSIKTLKEHGFFLESFASIPLCLDRGLVELETVIPSGNLQCTLDTGATWNMINRDVALKEFDPEIIEQYTSFRIGGENFGPIAFHPISIKLPINIEAILGMEFFSNHVVFLDFKNLQAYIYKSPDELDSTAPRQVL